VSAGHQGPGIPPRALGPVASAHTVPRPRGEAVHAGPDPARYEALPHRFVGGPSQPIGLRPALQPQAQLAVMAVHLVSRHSLGGHTGLQGPLQQDSSHRRLGLERDRVGHPGVSAAHAVSRPFLRPIPLTV